MCRGASIANSTPKLKLYILSRVRFSRAFYYYIIVHSNVRQLKK